MTTNRQCFTSIKQMLQSGYQLYPTAKVVKYGNRIYPSIRIASKAEGVSPSHIRRHCKVYDREGIRESVVSLIRF